MTYRMSFPEKLAVVYVLIALVVCIVIGGLFWWEW